MISVHICCPNEWHDGICDSFEARVYFEGKVKGLKSALLWVRDKTKDIDALDTCHGYRFEFYINGTWVADIDKLNKKFTLDQKQFNKVARDIAKGIIISE